jgi:hypothetical protein
MGKMLFFQMDGNHTALERMTVHQNDDYVPGTPEERIHLV